MTLRHVELVDKKEFVAPALNLEHKTYVIHVGSVSSIALPSSFPLALDDHPSCRPQIVGLIAEEAPTKILDKHIDFANIFFPDLASKLPMHTRINNHSIELVNTNGLIRSSKSLASALILFDWKLDIFRYLYIAR